jgi:hypothetical protein
MPNVLYTIDNDSSGATTAGQTVNFDTVTSSSSSVRCPVTVDLQLKNDGTWYDYVGNESNWPWISSYTSGTSFEIQTNDYATYANPESLSSFSVRAVATDVDS